MGRKKGTVVVDHMVTEEAVVDAAVADGDAVSKGESGESEENLYSGMETSRMEDEDFEADEFWSSDDQSGEAEYEEGEDGEESLPELTEEEIFGEDLDYKDMEDMDVIGGDVMETDEGTAEAGDETSAGASYVTAETVTEPKELSADGEADEAESATAKPKRAFCKKKAEAFSETAGDEADTAGQRDEVEQTGEVASQDFLQEESAVVQESGLAGAEVDPETNRDSNRELYPDMEELENAREEDDMFTEGSSKVDEENPVAGKGEVAAEIISAWKSAAGGSRRSSRTKKTEASVLTLEVRGEVETEDAREDAIWHEIHNAYRTRRILTGQLGGIEQTDNGKTIAIVDYKGFRIVIPLKEMMINVGRSPSGQEYAELMLRQNKILGNMLGAEIDFTVKGIDSKTRSVVASRREAMLKKRHIFYLDKDAAGMHRIYEGRVVQARVIAVAEKVIRVEVFGVECSIMARDLAWDWIGDAHERFSVGDQVLVRVLSVRRDSLDEIAVKADIKSVSQNTSYDNLKKCRIQSKYAGKVTDIHKGVVYIRLSNGVNAVAHSCYDYRAPGKKDDVSFAVTRIDEERGVAVGIITRIIRQNL